MHFPWLIFLPQIQKRKISKVSIENNDLNTFFRNGENCLGQNYNTYYCRYKYIQIYVILGGRGVMECVTEYHKREGGGQPKCHVTFFEKNWMHFGVLNTALKHSFLKKINFTWHIKRVETMVNVTKWHKGGSKIVQKCVTYYLNGFSQIKKVRARYQQNFNEWKMFRLVEMNSAGLAILVRYDLGLL